MIPAWKVRREMKRLQEQILGSVQLLRGANATRNYDASRSASLIETMGEHKLGDRVAAFLIYQPDDIAQSILETCEVLNKAGLPVLIISNARLTDKSLARLRPYCWKIIQRPNIGYDFGGYREAVLQVLGAQKPLKKMVIMNDSVWAIPSLFQPFLQDALSSTADLTGAVIRSKGQKRWIESYFYALSEEAINHDKFVSFWLGYRLVNSKYMVIRKGERDFSDEMHNAGLTLQSLGTNETFLDDARTWTSAQFRLALEFINRTDPFVGPAADRLLDRSSTSSDWQEDAIALFSRILGIGRVWNSSFPVLGHAIYGYPFIKKSREPLNWGWRDAVLAGVTGGHMPPVSEAILQEIKTRQSQGQDAMPHWQSKRYS